MRQRESVFSAKVKGDLAQLRGSWFERIQQQSIRGTPDRLGVIRGRFVGLETKVAGKKLEKLQAHKADLIRSAGGIVYRIDPKNWEEVFNELCDLSMLDCL